MIDIKNLSVQFTGSYLFENVNLKILPNDRIALVGSNGTGKSTFLKILAGQQDTRRWISPIHERDSELVIFHKN